MAVLIIFPHMLQNGGPTPFCHITITKTKINNNNNQFHTWTHIWWLLIRQCIKLYFLYARASIAIACISYGNSVLMVAVTSRYRSKPKWDRDHGFLRAKAALLSARLSHRNLGFYGFFLPLSPVRVYIIHKEAPRRWRHTRLWPKCTMVPMGRVQMICDFRNYNYWTENAIGFRTSRELCSNFL